MEKFVRNPALDLTRIAAFFCVASVHFFLNSEFYAQPMAGGKMYLMTLVRTSFMVCVPLFLVLTGYLMNTAVLNRRYYLGIVKTLGIYVLASIACLIFKTAYLGMEISVLQGAGDILNFSAANYAWYIEMYIGLFLLIPFLNLIYNNLKSKTQKRVLLLTCIVMTSLPGILNIYNFVTAGWWQMPSTSDAYSKILPNWWQGIYPVTYYFIGCYLKEFNVKLKKIPNILLWLITLLISGTFSYYRSRGGSFIWGSWQEWEALPNVILTVLVFLFFSGRNLEKSPKIVKKILAVLSNLCLGAYLVSYIFDQLFYAKLNAAIPVMADRFPYFLVVVPMVFACSLALSGVLNIIYQGLQTVFLFFYRKIRRSSRALPEE